MQTNTVIIEGNAYRVVTVAGERIYESAAVNADGTVDENSWGEIEEWIAITPEEIEKILE